MNATFVKLTIEVKANPGKLQELHQTLEAFLPVIRGENGCRECRISQDIEDGEVLVLLVHWDTRRDLERYIRSESGSALLGAIELLGETSKVGFGKDSLREGVDVLKDMRKKNLKTKE